MGRIQALTGNYSAAEGAALCHLDVVAAYPITPQSSVVETLAGKVHNGEIDANMVQVECEHSAMSVVQGASAGGARTFTATSAQGLALMFEPYFRQASLRYPMVMALATREMTSPETVWSGQQDAMIVRDAGWMQVFCDSNQEILDMIIQGYMIAEDPDVLIPINVCYDGFYSSHLTEGVDIPLQEEVDEILKPVSFTNGRLDPNSPLALDPMTPGAPCIRYRKNHMDAMEKAKDVIARVDKEFGDKFGRYYGGLISTYKMEDADVAIITIAGMTGTGMDAVDIARENGIKAGLIKLRFTRPFPAEELAEALANVKAWAVIDRSVCFGWNEGPMYMETKAALVDSEKEYCHFSAIGGLSGADISVDMIMSTIEKLDEQKDQSGEKELQWYFVD